MEIKVSVIMPSLNVVNYIEECMDSMINQTLEEIEIICIDAGSTDGTLEILNSYKNKLECSDKIRLYHSDVKSYGYQVNLGIKVAQGKYIAVMETDDFADKHMYEELVKIAFQYDLDAVKADCEWFYTLRNGKRRYEIWRLWNGQDNKYNTVLEPNMDAYLYEHDYSIWRGIYKREFIISNALWLSETMGAAFQDIGFGVQFLACAKQVYYSDKSFYRYRRDREDASARSLYGLRYVQQEFERMMRDTTIWNRLKCKQGFFSRMVGSFKGEYRRILELTGFDVSSKYLLEYYNWFYRVLSQAIAQSEFNPDYLQDNNKEELMLLLADNRKYAEEIQKICEKHRKQINPYLDKIGVRDVVVFGAGNWGRIMVSRLLKEKIAPIAIFDNNERLWGGKIFDISIRKPKCILENECILIANKKHGIEIAEQLINMGIQEGQIIFMKEQI